MTLVLLASITGTNALMPWMTPHTLTASAHSQSRSSCSHIAPSAPAPMPALLQTTCTAPNAASAASRSCADRLVRSVTSVGTPMTSSPSAVQLGDGLLQRLGLDVGEHDLHAGRAEALAHRAADAAGATGDDGDSPCSSLHQSDPDRREVVVALVHERRDPVGRNAAHDLAGLDARPLGELDAAELRTGRSATGSKRDSRRMTSPSTARANASFSSRRQYTSCGSPSKPLPLDRGQELEVEARARAVRCRLELAGDRGRRSRRTSYAHARVTSR